MSSARGVWDESSVAEEALKFSTRKAFSQGSYNAYQAAVRLKIMDKVCAHMTKVLKSWDEGAIRSEAAKYDKRSSFRKGCSSAYQAAWKAGMLDELFP